jgi:site-specific DNA recombinase
LLRNPFYKGQFLWEGRLYSGTQTPLVPSERFEQVPAVFRGHNKAKASARDFAYRGLLTCAYDNCTVTAEIKKEKYTYYRCTGFRGKCALPYFREEALGDRLGQILKDIHIPDDILAQLQKSLLNDKGREEEARKDQLERLSQRLAQVHRRMDQAYQDKLDGKIREDFWERKSAEWQTEECQIRSWMQVAEIVRPERILDAARILELANKAYFLYVRQNHTEKAKLLKTVLSNCAIYAVSLYPTYRKPFDLIFQTGKTKEWRARGDSNSRPSD